jgi:tetratricopeptide (TPR) repeat protein
MNETLKQFSADLLKDFHQALIKNQAEELLTKIKAAGDDSGSFKVVISTADEDRQGDALDQSKWKLDNYKKNAVVLWAHDYYNPPIGICTSISVEGKKLVAEGKFAPVELNPFAGQIAKLYEAGYISATSVGYIQHETGELELLEFSFVPVPANPFALSLRESKNLNLNIPQLVMKGMSFKTQGAVLFKSQGTAHFDTPWDAAAEVMACKDDLDKLKSISAWFDGEKADSKSSYKLPHHQASDGKAVWKGVAEALGALMGTRGTVDIPEADKKAVFEHLAGHYKEFGREIPDYEKAVELFSILKKMPELITKSSEIGDRCEQDDGTPGILAEDENNPGQLVCVPGDDKSEKSNQNEKEMNEKLFTDLKAEHARHGEAVGKSIDEFSEKCEKTEKAIDEYSKAVGELTGKISAENDAHLEKCMKAIDENYELQDQKKSIDEFKKAFQDEHAKHVEEFGKAIDGLSQVEHPGDGEELKKAIDTFTKSVSDELDRHEKAHVALSKGEFGQGDSDETKEIGELTMKIGRQISAKNKEKLNTIVKALEDHHSEHEKSTNTVIAAVKELIGSEEGDEGKEPKPSKALPRNQGRGQRRFANDISGPQIDQFFIPLNGHKSTR